MNYKFVNEILKNTAYPRISGTESEKTAAEYIKSLCTKMNFNAKIEGFPLTMYETKTANLVIDGKEIPCTAYFGSANKSVKAELFYLSSDSEFLLKKCKGKIALIDMPLRYAIYDKLTQNGAVGVITYNGNLCFKGNDIDQKELFFKPEEENLLPCVNVAAADAFDAVKNNRKTAEITTKQSSYIGESHNVILDIKGEMDETIVISAHYDSTPHSNGAYDNMSSCIGLFYLAEYFSLHRPKRSIRLLWCGSEERGLLGSEEYCAMHKTENEKTVLNVNLDMLGTVMGDFCAFDCINEEMERFLTKFLARHRFPATVKYSIRSSDSNSFIKAGIPAVSFGRRSPANFGTIHTRFDTAELVSAKRLLGDMKIIAQFTEVFANAESFPVSLEISDKIKTDIQNFFNRKTPAVKE